MKTIRQGVRQGIVIPINTDSAEAKRRVHRIMHAPTVDLSPADALLAEAALAAEWLDEDTLRSLTELVAARNKRYMLDAYDRSTPEQQRRFWEELGGPEQ